MNEGRLEYTFLWFIENYSYSWHKVGENLHSPYFTADELENTSWRLGVCPRGLKEKCKSYVSCFIYGPYDNGGVKEISLECELSFLGADGSLISSKAGKNTFKADCFPQGKGWKKFALMEDVHENTLVVRCRICKGEGKVRKFPPICARTHIVGENLSFLHAVENFSSLEPNQKKTAESRSESKNFILLSSLHFDCDWNWEGEITVEITPSDSNHILCKGKVLLVDASGNIIACGNNDNRLDVDRKDIRKLTLSLTRQDILNKKDEYLPDDKLSLLFECAFSTGQEFHKIEEIHHVTSTPDVKQMNNPLSCNGSTLSKPSAYPSVSEDMKALYLKQHLTDVQLTTKTKSFPAHKSVLCARSPVFDAMLTSDMKEKYKNCIEIDDLEDEIVQQMLLFLYSDTTENLDWKIATQLYYAGDKYQIGKLREITSSFLTENLSATNACELLLLADIHNDSDLKKEVEKFIFEHEMEVFGSKEWEMIVETNPILASKTMHLKYKRGIDIN